MNKNASIQRSIFTIILGIIMSTFGGCSDPDFQSLDLRGKLLIFGERQIVLAWPDTIPKQLDWDEKEALKFQCVSHNNELIFKMLSNRFPHPVKNATRRIIPGPLFYHDRESEEIALLDEMLKYSYACNSLDYIPDTKQYLFSGRINRKRGIYFMDTLFNITGDVFPMLDFGENDGGLTYVFFQDTNTIIIDRRGIIYIADVSDGKLKILDHGTIIGVSLDRQKLMVSIPQEEFYILETSTGDKTIIEENSIVTASTISPDGRYLAYTKLETYPFGPFRLYLYDMDREKSYRTEITDYGISSMIWLPESADVGKDRVGAVDN